MKEENKGASKNKWSRILQKKWFFPAMYLLIAALLLTAVVWYQNIGNQIPDAQKEEQGTKTDDYTPDPFDQDAESVIDQQEIIKMPVVDHEQAEIVTKFYDYNAEEEDQLNSLILYNNRYYQSTGIDIVVPDDEQFDVVAALSGTVAEVKEDPLLGNVVILEHANDVMTYYASLGDITVKAGEKVKQGAKLGTAGKNIFGKGNGTHVHFEIRKDGHKVNPEAFFNQPVSKLDSIALESDADESEDENESDLDERSAEDQKDQDDNDDDNERDGEKEDTTKSPSASIR